MRELIFIFQSKWHSKKVSCNTVELTLIFYGNLAKRDASKLTIITFACFWQQRSTRKVCGVPHYAFYFISNRFGENMLLKYMTFYAQNIFRWRSDWKYYIHQLYYHSLRHDIFSGKMKYIFFRFQRVLNIMKRNDKVELYKRNS